MSGLRPYNPWAVRPDPLCNLHNLFTVSTNHAFFTSTKYREALVLCAFFASFACDRIRQTGAYFFSRLFCGQNVNRFLCEYGLIVSRPHHPKRSGIVRKCRCPDRMVRQLVFDHSTAVFRYAFNQIAPCRV